MKWIVLPQNMQDICVVRHFLIKQNFKYKNDSFTNNNYNEESKVKTLDFLSSVIRFVKEYIMKKKSKWLSFAVKLIGIFATFSSLSGFAVQYYNQCLPSKISVTSGQEETISFHLPVKGTIRHKYDQESEMVINLSEPITLVAEELTSYDLELELFGLFALKDVELEIVPEKQLIPAGIPIGIYLETKGVLVVDVEEVEVTNGKVSPAKYILQEGDYVLAVNGEPIEKKSDFTSAILNSEGRSLMVTIKRNNQVFDAKVSPVLDVDGKYQLGMSIIGICRENYWNSDGPVTLDLYYTYQGKRRKGM